MKRRLIVSAVFLLLASAGLAWLLTTAAGMRWLAGIVLPRLPVDVSIGRMDGRLIGPIELKQLHVEGGNFSLNVEDAALDWSPRWGFPRAVTVHDLRVANVVVTLAGEAAHQGDTETAPFRMPDLDIDIEALELYTLAVQRGEQALVLLDRIFLDGRLEGQRVTLRQLEIESETYALAASGAGSLEPPYATDLETDWRLRLEGQPELAGTSRINGSLDALAVATMLTEPLAADVELAARDVLENLHWTLKARAAEVEPGRCFSGLPEGTAAITTDLRGDRTSLAGLIELDWPAVLPWPLSADVAAGLADGIIDVTRLELAATGTDTRLELSGRLDTHTLEVDATAVWQALSWPLTGDDAIVAGGGSARVTGSPDAYTYAADLKGVVRTIGEVDAHATGAGDTMHAVIERLDAALLGGTVSGRAEARWDGVPLITARLRGRGLQSHDLDVPLAASLDFNAQGRLTFTDSGPEYTVTVAELRGEAEGRDITGRLEISGTRERVTLAPLALTVSGNVLEANGTLGPEHSLQWRLDAHELGALAPGLAGSVLSSGMLYGSAEHPSLRGELHAEALLFGRLGAQQVESEFDVSLSNLPRSSLALTARAVRMDDSELGDIEVTLREADGIQQLDARLTDGDLLGSLTLSGHQEGETWRARLESMSLGLPGDAPWSLDAPVPLEISRQRVTLARAACLRRHDGSLCAAGNWAGDADWTLNAALQNISLPRLEPYVRLFVPDPPLLGGTLSGQVEIDGGPGTPPSARGRAYVEGGSVYKLYPGDEYDLIAFVGAFADFSVDATGIDARLGVDFGNEDRADATVRLVPDAAGQPGATRLEGQLTAGFADLSRAPLHFREFSQLAGNLGVSANLSGTRSKPVLTGTATLAGASAEVPQLGIRLREISVSADADLEGVTLTALASSGEGSARLAGELGWAGEGVTGRLQLTGEDLLAVDIPQARILVTPDISIDLQPGRVALGGEILIPTARLRPLTFAGAQRSSPDTVIISDEGTPAEERGYALDLDLLVRIGKDARFTGFGLDALLTGDLRLFNPQEVTAATGELRVTRGTYQIRTVRLDIESGALFWAGGPASNPGLRVRGIRQTRDVTVGVNVSGTLLRPAIDLFSDPPMSQSDILSYLAFGKSASFLTPEEGQDVNAANSALALAGGTILDEGVGRRLGIDELAIRSEGTAEESQLVLGKYLSPRIYVSYGIGLFEPINTLRMRLNITNRLILYTESGVEQSADVFYVIER